jgi:hypothetical protein
MRLGWVDGSNKLARNWAAGCDANSAATIASSPIRPLEHWVDISLNRYLKFKNPS